MVLAYVLLVTNSSDGIINMEKCQVKYSKLIQKILLCGVGHYRSSLCQLLSPFALKCVLLLS